MGIYKTALLAGMILQAGPVVELEYHGPNILVVFYTQVFIHRITTGSKGGISVADATVLARM